MIVSPQVRRCPEIRLTDPSLRPYVRSHKFSSEDLQIHRDLHKVRREIVETEGRKGEAFETETRLAKKAEKLMWEQNEE